jgi:hypothetical protein
MNTINPATLEASLAQFTGSNRIYNLYRYGLVDLTEGAKYLCDQAQCFWLVDIIASVQHKMRTEKFQVWSLTVKNGKGKVVCDDGNGNTLYTKRISFTDFPLPFIKVYFIQGTGVLLPSEY